MPTEEAKTWLPVKEAAQVARRYLQELIPEIPAEDISLEEIEPGNDEWLVTLGYTDTHHSTTFMPQRIYKLFRIDAIDGHVLSMNIRKP